MGTSNPYFTISRERGLPYGKVLEFVDWIEAQATSGPISSHVVNVGHMKLVGGDLMSLDDRYLIAQAVRDEHKRRLVGHAP